MDTLLATRPVTTVWLAKHITDESDTVTVHLTYIGAALQVAGYLKEWIECEKSWQDSWDEDFRKQIKRLRKLLKQGRYAKALEHWDQYLNQGDETFAVDEIEVQA